MTSNELKDLVKSHFSLVEANEVEVTTEETFGEIADENKAFVIKFPGDSLQVGDKVTVETSDGQTLDAPDGEHKLEDGTEIVTKDSVVTEIKGADGEKALSEEAEAKTEMAEETEEEKMEEEVEVEVEAAKFEEIVKVIVDEVKDEMGKMKTKMEELEDKMSKMSAYEAAEPTLPSTSKKETAKRGFKAFNVEESLNADRIKMTLKELKLKK
tara:strand:- start:107 stop:742 length:636 start_codon:yes stop_codon:yes gene_type:complete